MAVDLLRKNKCVFCKKESNIICLCGYCRDCTKQYKHIKLNQMMRDRNK